MERTEAIEAGFETELVAPLARTELVAPGIEAELVAPLCRADVASPAAFETEIEA